MERFKDKKILTIIPAYNEKGSIGKVIKNLKKVDPDMDVLVIDDGSEEDFSLEVAEAGAMMVRHIYNLGYGNALQTGYKYAIYHDYDIVAQIDGDGQHDPAFIPLMIDKLLKEDLHVVIGSRFMGEESYDPGFFRRMGMIIFRTLTSIILRKKLTDVTSGYQVLSREALKFCTRDIYPSDYPDADVIILLHFYGYRVGEIAVRMFPSQDKKGMHSGLNSLFYIFKMFLSMFLMLLRKRK